MIKKFLFLFIFILSFPVQCFANLSFNGFISDNANVISNESENYLNSILLELQKKTGADIAVITLNSLNGGAIEDTSIQLARKYKLGDKKLNNGALVLVVPNDRKARIEVGYGLEGIVTDADCGIILDDYMIPYFKNNDYETGIIQGALALAFEIADGYNIKLSFEKPSPVQSDSDDTLASIFIILFIIFMIINGKGRFGGGFGGGMFGGRGGGSGSSGISFGGGGGFGGGGASRGW